MLLLVDLSSPWVTFKHNNINYNNKLDDQDNVLHTRLVVTCKSVNNFYPTVPSTGNQQDGFYRAKFLAAIRLWKKREEEKRVCVLF